MSWLDVEDLEPELTFLTVYTSVHFITAHTHIRHHMRLEELPFFWLGKSYFILYIKSFNNPVI